MKTCPSCNTINLPEAAFCASCSAALSPGPRVGAAPNQQWQQQGGPLVGQPPAAGAGASQKAIIALVLAIAAFFCCGPLTGIAAAIVGWMEISAINTGQSSPAGKWMAQVGLWGGIASTVIHVVIWILYLIFAVLSTARF